jgi:hypothetical protein
VSAMRPYIGIVHFERIVQLRPLLRDQRSKTEVSRLSDGSPYRVMGWMAPLRHRGAKVLADANQQQTEGHPWARLQRSV